MYLSSGGILIPQEEQYVICWKFDQQEKAFFKDLEEIEELYVKIFWTKIIQKAKLLQKDSAITIINTYIKHECRTVRYV